MRAVRTSWIIAVTLLLSAGGLAVRAAGAPPAASSVAVHQDSAEQPHLSMDQAVRLAERRYRARVVRVETQTQGGRTIYVLRMLDDAGRVFAVRVDAVNGTIS